MSASSSKARRVLRREWLVRTGETVPFQSFKREIGWTPKVQRGCLPGSAVLRDAAGKLVPSAFAPHAQTHVSPRGTRP